VSSCSAGVLAKWPPLDWAACSATVLLDSSWLTFVLAYLAGSFLVGGGGPAQDQMIWPVLVNGHRPILSARRGFGKRIAAGPYAQVL